ncbi:hypothetical protein SUDANB96_02417 [Streptomyces sp. enrichment culture]
MHIPQPKPAVGGAPGARVPACARPVGHDTDVFERTGGSRSGGDQPGSRLVSPRNAAWADGPFVTADGRQ